MRIKNATMKELKDEAKKKQIVCFGAAKMGREALETPGLGERIIEFIDNDKNKQGKVLRKQGGHGIPVVSLDEIDICARKNIFVLITSGAYDEIIKTLEKAWEGIDVDVYIYAKVKLNIDKGSKEWYEHRFMRPIKRILKNYLGYRYEEPEREKIFEEKMRNVYEFVNNGKRVVPAITFMLTSRCTLNCKECLALTPFFKGREYDIPVETILRDMEKFFESIDYCSWVGFLGGEPFLYEGLDKLLAYVNENEKVESVFIPSNGTVLPDDAVIRQLQNPKVHVGLSYYGFLDEMSRIVTVFEKNHILFRVIPMDEIWVRSGGIEARGKSEQEIREDNIRCLCAQDSRNIQDGKLYCCGRIARLHMLGVTDSQTDYVDLNDECPTRRWEKIQDLYLRDYAQGCDYCDFGGASPVKVKSGEQIERRDISKYLICNQSEYDELKRKAELWDLLNVSSTEPRSS